MFNFLKKLFSGRKEEIAKKEEVKVEELGNWFKNKSDNIFSGLDVKVTEIKNRIKEEITKTKDNLSILSIARLQNPKISVRETQFMEGNRNAYILGVNNFLRGIDLENKDYPALLEYCNNFNLTLEKFGKSTFRPYHILQEFFAHESRDVAINTKNIDHSIKELRKAIENANIHKINEIKSLITELNNKVKQKNDLERALKESEKIKDGLIQKKESVEVSINELKKSKEYKQLNDLRANKEVLLTSIREHNAKVIHAFSVMERPLRKLTRVVFEGSELLEQYIENPVSALISDNELKIIGLLKKLEENLNNFTLELKDKKREKVLDTVNFLTEEFLIDFVSKHNELNKKIKDAEKEINENEALKREKKLNYELDDIKDDLGEVNKEIENKNSELRKINIDEMKNNLEKEVNELLKANIVIS